jgi:hypothetical protein
MNASSEATPIKQASLWNLLIHMCNNHWQKVNDLLFVDATPGIGTLSTRGKGSPIIFRDLMMGLEYLGGDPHFICCDIGRVGGSAKKQNGTPYTYVIEDRFNDFGMLGRITALVGDSTKILNEGDLIQGFAGKSIMCDRTGLHYWDPCGMVETRSIFEIVRDTPKMDTLLNFAAHQFVRKAPRNPLREFAENMYLHITEEIGKDQWTRILCTRRPDFNGTEIGFWSVNNENGANEVGKKLFDRLYENRNYNPSSGSERAAKGNRTRQDANSGMKIEALVRKGWTNKQIHEETGYSNDKIRAVREKMNREDILKNRQG